MLGERLRTTVDIYRKTIIPTRANRFVYGICNQMDDCKRLCRFDAASGKTSSCASVSKFCSVLQAWRRVFVAGGANPTTNALSEFVEKSGNLVRRAGMIHAKYNHTLVSLPGACFMSIGGRTGPHPVSFCERYSTISDRWTFMPSLFCARESSAAALHQERFVYAIGGHVGGNSIERLDVNLGQAWEMIELAVKSPISFNVNPAAFLVSTEEIMILSGNLSATAGVFSIAERTIRKLSPGVKKDWYGVNAASTVGKEEDPCVMGKDGTVHIYRRVAAKFEEPEFLSDEPIANRMNK